LETALGPSGHMDRNRAKYTSSVSNLPHLFRAGILWDSCRLLLRATAGHYLQQCWLSRRNVPRWILGCPGNSDTRSTLPGFGASSHYVACRPTANATRSIPRNDEPDGLVHPYDIAWGGSRPDKRLDRRYTTTERRDVSDI